jgi:HSP20 family molecular chaperone IbpA
LSWYFNSDFDDDNEDEDDKRFFSSYKRRRRRRGSKRRSMSDPLFNLIEDWFDSITRAMDFRIEAFLGARFLDENPDLFPNLIRELNANRKEYEQSINGNDAPTSYEINTSKTRKYSDRRRRGGRQPGMKATTTGKQYIDLIEYADNFTIVAELPMVEKNDISIEATNNNLITISVINHTPKFQKRVLVPSTAIIDEAKATYKNGVLQIVIPKSKKSISKPKKTKKATTNH